VGRGGATKTPPPITPRTPPRTGRRPQSCFNTTPRRRW
jgi:hypothetical protein